MTLAEIVLSVMGVKFETVDYEVARNCQRMGENYLVFAQQKMSDRRLAVQSDIDTNWIHTRCDPEGLDTNKYIKLYNHYKNGGEPIP